MTGFENRQAPLPDGLHCVDLPQSLLGFRRFISAWFFRDALGRRVLIDPGPANTIPLLLRELDPLTNSMDLIHIPLKIPLSASHVRFPSLDRKSVV